MGKEFCRTLARAFLALLWACSSDKSCPQPQAPTWALPGMCFFSSWVAGIAWLIGSFPQNFFLNKFTKSQQVNWYFSEVFHYEIVSILMWVFKTQLKPNNMKPEQHEALKPEVGVLCKNITLNTIGFMPRICSQLLVQMKFSSLNKK